MDKDNELKVGDKITFKYESYDGNGNNIDDTFEDEIIEVEGVLFLKRYSSTPLAKLISGAEIFDISSE